MWKNLFVALVLSLIMTSCDLINGGGGGIEIVPEPKLILTVSHDTVPYGGQLVTITVKATNTAYTDNNQNLKQNSASWKDSIFVNETTELVVSAFNKFGSFVKEKRTITVLPPYIPTRMDTISCTYWKLDSIEGKYEKEDVWELAYTLSERQINSFYYFDSSGNFRSTYKGESFSQGRWTWVDKTHLERAGQVYYYIMTYSKLTLYITDNNYIFKYNYSRPKKT